MLHLTPLKSLLLASALALLAATPASAQEKFRVITTFTVIADMAQNVAGEAHPSATIYEKYSRQYTAIIHTLIEYLPPKEKKNISRLAALRNG